MLLLDRLTSFGGGGGRFREELADRTESFSIGGGGLSESGLNCVSGKRGRSDMAPNSS